MIKEITDLAVLELALKFIASLEDDDDSDIYKGALY